MIHLLKRNFNPLALESSFSSKNFKKSNPYRFNVTSRPIGPTQIVRGVKDKPAKIASELAREQAIDLCKKGLGSCENLGIDLPKAVTTFAQPINEPTPSEKLKSLQLSGKVKQEDLDLQQSCHYTTYKNTCYNSNSNFNFIKSFTDYFLGGSSVAKSKNETIFAQKDSETTTTTTETNSEPTSSTFSSSKSEQTSDANDDDYHKDTEVVQNVGHVVGMVMKKEKPPAPESFTEEMEADKRANIKYIEDLFEGKFSVCVCPNHPSDGHYIWTSRTGEKYILTSSKSVPQWHKYSLEELAQMKEIDVKKTFLAASSPLENGHEASEQRANHVEHGKPISSRELDKNEVFRLHLDMLLEVGTMIDLFELNPNHHGIAAKKIKLLQKENHDKATLTLKALDIISERQKKAEDDAFYVSIGYKKKNEPLKESIGWKPIYKNTEGSNSVKDEEKESLWKKKKNKS